MPTNTVRREEEEPRRRRPLRERGVHNRELAQERTDRGRARDREETDEEETMPDWGTRRSAPLTSAVRLARVGPVDVRRRKEQHALGQSVVDQV